MSEQVRKEYGKCLRTHCCSGKSVDSSMASGKGAASRAPGRYSAGSQVAPTHPVHPLSFQASSVDKKAASAEPPGEESLPNADLFMSAKKVCVFGV